MEDSSETPAEQRPNRTEDHVTSRETEVGSGAPPGVTEQAVTSLKVTIQQSSENREFRQTDRPTDRQTGLHCHVCDLTCGSLQVFQEHMATAAHLRRLTEVTRSASSTASKLHRRRRGLKLQRWCDTCQTHFNSDVISHRQSRQHKEWKKRARPFCPVCQRHFRTPRKFVEHMKSVKHKQQVLLQEHQEEELVTVDAIGCFQEEEEEEEELREEGGGGQDPHEQNPGVDPGADPALLPQGGVRIREAGGGGAGRPAGGAAPPGASVPS